MLKRFKQFFSQFEPNPKAPDAHSLPLQSADSVPHIKLAASRGFNQEVVGEGRRQEAFIELFGQKKASGINLERDAQLVFDDGNPVDPNAVGVLLDGLHVGYIPSDDAAAFRQQILAINPDELPIICSAKIVGGWDRGNGDEGHFGVKLSILKPLKSA